MFCLRVCVCVCVCVRVYNVTFALASACCSAAFGWPQPIAAPPLGGLGLHVVVTVAAVPP